MLIIKVCLHSGVTSLQLPHASQPRQGHDEQTPLRHLLGAGTPRARPPRFLAPPRTPRTPSVLSGCDFGSLLASDAESGFAADLLLVGAGALILSSCGCSGR